MPRPIIAVLIAGHAVCRDFARRWVETGTAWRRPLFGLAAALLIGLLVDASGAAAQTSGQGAPATRAQLEAEYNQAFEQMLKNPADLDLTFRYADLATQLGNYEAAISALEAMVKMVRSVGTVTMAVNTPCITLMPDPTMGSS